MMATHFPARGAMLITAPSPDEIVYEMAVSLSPLEAREMDGFRSTRGWLTLRCAVENTEVVPGIIKRDYRKIECGIGVKGKKA